MNPWRRMDRPLAIAHRGHSIEAPENTMAAYRWAIDLGVEMIEADINITRDGRLAMIHDYTLDRTTDGQGKVSACTWAELERLDAGAWFDGRFTGEAIPSTEALLDLAKEAGIGLCLEVKGADGAESLAIAERLADLMVACDALGWAFVSGYDHAALAAQKARIPDLMLAPDRIPDNVPADPADACQQATRISARVIQNHHAFLAPDLVAELHRQDLAVWAWPTTDDASLNLSIERGADGVMGDDIRTMLRILDELRPRPDVSVA